MKVPIKEVGHEIIEYAALLRDLLQKKSKVSQDYGDRSKLERDRSGVAGELVVFKALRAAGHQPYWPVVVLGGGRIAGDFDLYGWKIEVRTVLEGHKLLTSKSTAWPDEVTFMVLVEWAPGSDEARILGVTGRDEWEEHSYIHDLGSGKKRVMDKKHLFSWGRMLEMLEERARCA